jgi:hypothetical protein
MSAIQSGANWWVDSFVRFPGGGVGQNYRAGIMIKIGGNPDSLTLDDDTDSLSSIISDVEEEGEVDETHEHTEAEPSTADVLSDAIESGKSDIDSSAEIVASTAAHIGLIESAMRQHQASGVAKFVDDKNDEDLTDDSFETTLNDEMQQNPSLAFAAATPSQDRLGILALLSMN